MQDELRELLEAAMYKEIASQAFYIAGQNNTEDPGAKVLMKELAEEELRHLQMLKEVSERDWKEGQWHRENIPNMRISEYLTGGDKLEGLVFAIKHEERAVQFYSQMMSAFRHEDAKRLCERLVHEELKHKQRLELFYDEFFYGED